MRAEHHMREAVICPFCDPSADLPPPLKECLVRELEAWDRRFDSAGRLLDDLLELSRAHSCRHLNGQNQGA